MFVFPYNLIHSHFLISLLPFLLSFYLQFIHVFFPDMKWSVWAWVSESASVVSLVCLWHVLLWCCWCCCTMYNIARLALLWPCVSSNSESFINIYIHFSFRCHSHIIIKIRSSTIIWLHSINMFTLSSGGSKHLKKTTPTF